MEHIKKIINCVTKKDILKKAQEAARNAYNIYSNFYVGDCVTDGNAFYAGCCMENISFA